MNLTATYYFDKIEDISYKLFEENNIKGVLVDLDNTLINSKAVLSKTKKEWVKKMQKHGIQFCIVSNSSSEKKVESFRRKLDVLGFFAANKPAKKGYLLAERLLGIPKEQCIMIGDQIFTDIYGANKIGMKSILVKPFDRREPIIVKIKRPLESIILNKYLGKKGVYVYDK